MTRYYRSLAPDTKNLGFLLAEVLLGLAAKRITCFIDEIQRALFLV
jgi:hypothetical protein